MWWPCIQSVRSTHARQLNHVRLQWLDVHWCNCSQLHLIHIFSEIHCTLQTIHQIGVTLRAAGTFLVDSLEFLLFRATYLFHSANWFTLTCKLMNAGHARPIADSIEIALCTDYIPPISLRYIEALSGDWCHIAKCGYVYKKSYQQQRWVSVCRGGKGYGGLPVIYRAS